MVQYTCQRCNYSTNRKSSYDNHLKRKKPCFIKTDIVVKKEKKSFINDKKIENIASNNSANEENEFILSKNKLECIYCLKILSRIDNLKRHQKICKSLKNKTQVEIENINLKIKLEKVEKELEKIKERPTTTIINNKNGNTKNINNYYCVPLDTRSIKRVFDVYYDSDVFYAGPDMVIKLLYEELFNKEIFLLDYGRQKFQYKCTVEKDKEGKVVIDIKNENALDKISKEYQRHTYCISEEELVKYRDNMRQTEIIEETANKHDEASKTLNVWSKKWSRVLSS